VSAPSHGPLQASARRSLEAAVERAFAVQAAEAPAVLDALQACVCRGGEWLFRQDDPGDALYLLVRGRLQVWITATEQGEPQQTMVAEIAPGETVGEIGLLTGGKRSAGIRALRDSLLLRMDAAAFDRLGRERPQLIRQLAGSIAERLRQRTGGPSANPRKLRTIAILPLDQMDHATALAGQLGASLGRRGPTLVLTSERLAALGAPPVPTERDSAASAAMTEWLATVEDDHRFLLLVADAGDTAWSRLALRHADQILLTAAASGDPALRPWEQSLLGDAQGPMARRALLLTHDGSPALLTGTARWLRERPLDYHLHLRADVADDLQRLARVLAGESLGIVFGGGAARGFAHLGVYRALHEAGIPVDWVGGASIGAVMGIPIARALDPGAAIEMVREAFVGGKPFGDYTLPIVSLLRGRRLDRLLARHLHEHIEDLPIPYFCVSSNLGRGTAQVHTRGPLAPAIRASVSLPGIFPPAVIDGQLAIDGGILDNLPVDLMRAQPVGQVIAVDLTSRQTFEVDYSAVPSPWRLLAGRMLPFTRRYRVPSFMSIMLKATEVGTMTAVRAAGDRADLLLRPPVSRFSITDVRAFDRIVDAGYEDARQAIEDWQRTRELESRGVMR
jgi:predicted acylesterase/phospholipase RssA/CRP-like cAMP-binding protein